MIILFYLFNLFEGLFIIIIDSSSFKDNNNITFAQIKILIYLITIYITIIYYKISNIIFKFIKIFYLKFLKSI